MKCLVTGGEGFIGSHIVDRLIEEGHDVVSVDDHSAQSNLVWYQNNLASNHQKSILDVAAMYDLFEQHKFDYVFHLAAISRIQIGINEPITTATTNYLGTANLLDLSLKHGVKKFIFSSTSSIYGRAHKIPYAEDMADCLTPYSVAKLGSEKLCRVYTRMHGLPTVSLRYFNVYGEREPIKGEYAPVIGLFLKQRKEGKPLTVVGDGMQSRDFTYIKDAVQANILAMIAPNWANGKVFNIGSGKSYSILQIAEMISNKIKHIPERRGEARHTLANLASASSSLNYRPQYNLTDYIKEQIKTC